MTKNKLNPNDQDLFRCAMRGVKPLVTPKVEISHPVVPVTIKKKEVLVDEKPLSPFSDHEFLDSVGSDQTVEFACGGISVTMLRRLRQGREPIEAILDLHGKRVEEAREALYHFLSASHAQGKVGLLIIHGKGRGDRKPILKNKLNHWLRQSELVLAFCSAQPKDGGKGALYLRIKRGK